MAAKKTKRAAVYMLRVATDDWPKTQPKGSWVFEGSDDVFCCGQAAEASTWPSIEEAQEALDRLVREYGLRTEIVRFEATS